MWFKENNFQVGELLELRVSEEFKAPGLLTPIWEGDLVIFISKRNQEESIVYYIKEGIYRPFFTHLLNRV